jgi:hypothetical protein
MSALEKMKGKQIAHSSKDESDNLEQLLRGFEIWIQILG